ncbi:MULTISPECIES: ATP cone domain-containing protein [Sphingobacterium]|uniref:ATP cone domain-containing protein n=1 Tax=Sphingobacterium kitahiroshimense TaxID=470446 RepID=A0ABV0BVP4_9SPHI|nr:MULTISPECIES: ATP cone domain-containing protein [Sphingobacterium]MBB2950313.1 Holliday junction resolvase [Sphingobacterium sp. JUb56]MCW2258833.1 Holliday junction resolvase [Sphingobacterium kitahiroshimense]NJI73059.1 restriction endonuclease [Sphingobacterium sp. B16(2022)]TCR14713.1 restriction endonuclease [Sphingobacterium sp. JUb78]
MLVKKYSGELVPFNSDSLRHSLTRSGANNEQVEKVYTQIKEKLFDGISTRELYQLAFEALKSQRNSFAARYSLKKALRELGPEGFYFEKWIARLFQEYGFESTTGQTIQGHAVSHEIDVVASKGNEMLAIECKFRNDIDAKISVTTPMYFLSRFKDISDISYHFFGQNKKFTQGWLVTNAYLTSDSKDFGKYYNVNFLSWDYPTDNSIKKRVDKAVFYPVTCLTTLTDVEEKTLLQNQIILVKDIINNKEALKSLKLDSEKLRLVLEEARELIDYKLEEE